MANFEHFPDPPPAPPQHRREKQAASGPKPNTRMLDSANMYRKGMRQAARVLVSDRPAKAGVPWRKMRTARKARQKMLIRSPPVEWKPLFQYELKNLRNDFQIADFEREVSTKHVHYLKDAIMSNKFYNNMISATQGDKPWNVFDGQHRLSALWLCHIEEGLKKYNLMLGLYPKDYARIVYRRINMGKPLLARHHLKALDDKKNPFFTKLEPWLSHHPRPDKPLYMTMLQAFVYARGYGKAAGIDNVDYVLEQTTAKEIETGIKLCEVTASLTKEIFGERLYHVPIYRNVFKATLVHNLNHAQIEKLINKMLKDHQIKEIAKTRNHADVAKVFDYIEAKILPEILSK